MGHQIRMDRKLSQEQSFLRPVFELISLPSDWWNQFENLYKATNSLTVLIDIPIAVVLMFQLYRESIEDIFKLVISTLLLKPSQRAKELESFNKDLFITLIGVQGQFSIDPRRFLF